ncbi:MAG: acylphosphatase [Alphaproteobacteria bacterium]|nr:acylphosphatase [Alphaproteobacteria bacterium]
MSPKIVHVTVRGRVQGVGYRAWVAYQAITIGLEGWVRNRRDGSVEALFSGAPQEVAQMVALCRHGPPLAQVTSVRDEPAASNEFSPEQEGRPFAVLATV